MNDSVETVNAAATAIMMAGTRVQQVTSPRRRWGGWLGMYWCFGSQRTGKRINHAVVIPETTPPESNPAPPENAPLPTSTVALPFVVPPPSPASIMQSEPGSSVHSPMGMFSLTTLSASHSSPGGTASIFAIGPYAHETQLVSPPAFTTEPSTAPFTPPPESVHFTNPPSPEVPFAQLLTSTLDSNLRKGDYSEFYKYQLYPGSPIGNLISPSSLCSGTSSPFPDLELHSSVTNGFPIAEPPMLLNVEDLALLKAIPLRLRGGVLVPQSQVAMKETIEGTKNNTPEQNPFLDRKLSFALADEKVTNCLDKEPGDDTDARTVESELPLLLTATQTEVRTQHHVDEAESVIACNIGETREDLSEKIRSSVSDRAEKEFIFDNADGTSSEPIDVGSDWWTNEKVISAETGESKNWAFSPLKEPRFS